MTVVLKGKQIVIVTAALELLKEIIECDSAEEAAEKARRYWMKLNEKKGDSG